MGRKPARTFNEAVERWVREELPHKKSKQSFLYKLSRIAPILEGRLLSEVDTVCSQIRAQGGARFDAMKPATINRHLAIVRRLLSLAYKRWGWLDEPLHQRVELLPEKGERHVYLTEDEVEALAASCKHAGDALLLAAYTGIRKSQLLRLTRANVVGDCLHLGTDSKTVQPQVIPLHPRVQGIAATLPLRCTPPVLRREFEKAREAIGRPDIHFHDLRHTFASWLIQSGADLMHVRDFLGHSTVAVTQRYAHLKTENLREVLHKVGTKKKTRKAKK